MRLVLLLSSLLFSCTPASASPFAAVRRRLDFGFLGRQPKDPVFSPAPPRPEYTKKEWFELQVNYLAEEKQWPYVGSQIYLGQAVQNTQKFFNSLAVFPNQDVNRLHGTVGLYPNGTRAFRAAPEPPKITEENKKEALRNGGFYLALSDHLPLDRNPPDARPSVCRRAVYDISKLDDVSIIITFYNEPVSTLMRTVHSVLNQTPPPLLREIILVDDFSNTSDVRAGGFLDEYVTLLPKVKVMRLPERRGLVMARLAGAKVAQAPVLVILDSHVEVNHQWLEPQLQRLMESPESIVFPQIASIENESFDFIKDKGIGCRISFKWTMQEKSQATLTPDSTDAIPTASMAGGLFAVRAQWFWELGGYDEEFSMWGAENVEIGFRTWMCGGRLECTPCALTYHIYRNGGSGYSSPPQALWKNRLRTARVWADDYFQLSSMFIAHPDFDMGPLDKMLEMKERMRCKDFSWFLEHVDKTQPIRSLDNLDIAGEIKNQQVTNVCLDTLSHSKADQEFGAYYCHGSGGTQGFLRSNDTKQIHLFNDETMCLSSDSKIHPCTDLMKNNEHWDINSLGQLIWTGSNRCLTLVSENNENSVTMKPCDETNKFQLWTYKPFQRDPNFKSAQQFSSEYQAKRLDRQKSSKD